jgi:hypothetical protein
MKVRNVSARLHHVGNVSIAPGEENNIPKGFENAFNAVELVVINELPADSINIDNIDLPKPIKKVK